MGYQDIFAAELDARLRDGAILYDVRERDEYTQGHIPGAINVPLSELPARADEITGPAVIVCLSGGRSAQAASFLDVQGQTGLMNLTGGTMGWIREGREVRTGDQP
ncbi:rhodanese-like domain-containing protein [Deinococcus sp.]|uniref:rhodanese-like domain-containing protein n=1 Tax=Deinococcus sp. TaxID=47478 RepID=UPI0028699402|nr:rhodanese-like domain-containing protein [Deinococcus sp.]